MRGVLKLPLNTVGFVFQDYHLFSRLTTEAQRIQDMVALFVALGGGWWNAQPISEK